MKNDTLFIYIRQQLTSHKLLSFLSSFCLLLLCLCVTGCKNTPAVSVATQEDLKSKEQLQGIWIDEDDSSVSFRVKGDTIYYPDSISEPVCFKVVSDTLILESSRPSRYSIKLLTQQSFRFVNSDGDEVHLLKGDNNLYLSLFEKQAVKVNVNQGKLLKRDTVMLAGDVRYHAYIQVNPTTYKVYRQSMNDDGVQVDNAYYDNIIHLALYDGPKPLVNKDYRKTDFSSCVPKDFISQCVFSDILAEKATAEGVYFTGILSVPDTYTSYNVTIFVSREGKVNLSVN